MKTIKELVLAASEKVVMNGVTNIKEIYPDSTVFANLEEFEAHVIDRAIDYLIDVYSEEEEYTAGTWTFASACSCEDEWLFLIDGDYYFMNYCDLDNEAVEILQHFIWDKNVEEFSSRIGEKLNVETNIDIYTGTYEGKEIVTSTIEVVK